MNAYDPTIPDIDQARERLAAARAKVILHEQKVLAEVNDLADARFEVGLCEAELVYIEGVA